MPTLDEALESLLTGTEVKVLISSISGEGNLPRWNLVVDTPAGVTIGEITDLTRRIRKDETVTSILRSDEVRVEITSPGTKYGLREPWQFPRHIGRKLKVLLAGDDPEDSDKQFVTGKLSGVAESGISIELAEGRRDLTWQDIEKALVVTDW